MDEIDWGSVFNDVGGDILSGGLNYGLNQLSNLPGDQALSDYSAARYAAADTLNQGFDAQLAEILAGLEKQGIIAGKSFSDVARHLDKAKEDYALQTRLNIPKYAGMLYPAVGRYAEGMTGTAEDYAGDVGQVAGDVSQLLKQGSAEYGQILQPWEQGGKEALGYYQNVLAQNPYELTPQQLRAKEAQDRQIMATLSASGLRGAGRGGVATAMDAMQAADAQRWADNQARKDAAAGALANSGFSAATNLATNRQSLADALGDVRYKTGMNVAQDTRDVGRNIYGTALGAEQDVAGKMYDSEGRIVDTRYGTNRDIANLKGKYYSDLSGIVAGKYGAKGDTALAKAQSNATVANDLAGTSYAWDQTKANQTGAGINQVGGSIINTIRDAINSKNKGVLQNTGWTKVPTPTAKPTY